MIYGLKGEELDDLGSTDVETRDKRLRKYIQTPSCLGMSLGMSLRKQNVTGSLCLDRQIRSTMANLCDPHELQLPSSQTRYVTVSGLGSDDAAC
jgi:hypothetical protein